MRPRINTAKRPEPANLYCLPFSSLCCSLPEGKKATLSLSAITGVLVANIAMFGLKTLSKHVIMSNLLTQQPFSLALNLPFKRAERLQFTLELSEVQIYTRKAGGGVIE